MLYPDPGEPFPELDRDHVWLFHGTTPEIAQTIRREGWASPDPGVFIAAAAKASGVDPARLTESYHFERYERNLASCSTGWRQAASYARRGPEFAYFIQRAVGLATVGEPTWMQTEGAVMLLAVSWSAIESVDKTARRDSFLPDRTVWRTDIEFAMGRAPDPILLPPTLFDASIFGVDRVADACSCASGMVVGHEEIQDPRLRCSACYLGSLV